MLFESFLSKIYLSKVVLRGIFQAGETSGYYSGGLGSGTINAITYILKHLGLGGHDHSSIYESLGFLVEESV